MSSSGQTQHLSNFQNNKNQKAGGKNKGRQKVIIQKMENENNMRVTFSKRRAGLFKKASELCILCGVEAVVVVFSRSNKAYSFGHPSVEAISQRFLTRNNNFHANNIVMNRQFVQSTGQYRNLPRRYNEYTLAKGLLEEQIKRAADLEEKKKLDRGQNWYPEVFNDGLTPLGLRQMKEVLVELKKKVNLQLEKNKLASDVNPNVQQTKPDSKDENAMMPDSSRIDEEVGIHLSKANALIGESPIDLSGFNLSSFLGGKNSTMAPISFPGAISSPNPLFSFSSGSGAAFHFSGSSSSKTAPFLYGSHSGASTHSFGPPDNHLAQNSFSKALPSPGGISSSNAWFSASDPIIGSSILAPHTSGANTSSIGLDSDHKAIENNARFVSTVGYDIISSNLGAPFSFPGGPNSQVGPLLYGHSTGGGSSLVGPYKQMVAPSYSSIGCNTNIVVGSSTMVPHTTGLNTSNFGLPYEPNDLASKGFNTSQGFDDTNRRGFF